MTERYTRLSPENVRAAVSVLDKFSSISSSFPSRFDDSLSRFSHTAKEKD